MNERTASDAQAIVTYLEDHRCKDVHLIDVSDRSSWTDCFIIATVNSVGHLRGVVHNIWDLLNERGIAVANRQKKPAGDGWELIDCGDIIVHLMSEELREFYALERLWREL
ncbi:MAG: ribosome silencing factor [Sphaerochaeta sp.]